VKDGIVQEWNKSNPDKAIQADDLIIEVNGIKDTSEALLGEIKSSTKLEFTISRG